VNIRMIPESVKQLPFQERQQALQDIVNAELHRQNICPMGEFVAGPRAPRVGVYRAKRRWYVSASFDNEEQLERIAIDAIHTATVNQVIGGILG
jgi:hypothetical protein